MKIKQNQEHKNLNPKVTVYIPVYNYGKYLRQAINSVLNQNYDSWELIVIDDGSTDGTPKVLEGFKGHPKIRIHSQKNMGLPMTNNRAISLAYGEYIMRLDADDYLDENALLVLSNVLDHKPDVGLVYPDYFIVSEEGEIIRLERRKKIGEEVELLDLPAHGACTMIRKSCLECLGGYNEQIKCQDGYDLWIRAIQRYSVYNVNLPLFYYRMHSGSLTSCSDHILRTRQLIKRNFVAQQITKLPRVLAIIPASGTPAPNSRMEALYPIAGRHLIDYTILAAINSNSLDRIVVTSDSQQIRDYTRQFQGVEQMPRSHELARPGTFIEPTVLYVLSELQRKDDYTPDAVMLLFINSPLRESRHIQKAIDTMIIFNCNSVISVREDNNFFYRHEKYGLKPLFQSRKLRFERDIFYAENAAVLLSRTGAITPDSFTGKTVGHIIMTQEESFQVDSEFGFWLVEQIIRKRIASEGEWAL